MKRFTASTKKIGNYFQNLLPAERKDTEDEYFFVKTGTELRKILLTEILYFESQILPKKGLFDLAINQQKVAAGPKDQGPSYPYPLGT